MQKVMQDGGKTCPCPNIALERVEGIKFRIGVRLQRNNKKVDQSAH